MKGYRGFTATLAACILSLCGATHSTFGAGTPSVQLQLIATDTNARVAIVKLDDGKPRLWRQGEILVAGTHILRLRECTDDRAVVETAQSSAQGMMQIVLISVGQNYSPGDAVHPPTVSNRVAPMTVGGKSR